MKKVKIEADDATVQLKGLEDEVEKLRLQIAEGKPAGKPSGKVGAARQRLVLLANCSW